VLDILSIVAVGLYAFAAVQLTRQFRYRRDPILLAMAAALVLLAEALVAMVVSRNWHFSWWEWHLLLLAAFATIALAAQHAYQRRGSLAGAFGGLYLDATLASVERWYASAVASVAAAESSGSSTDLVLAQLRREGATEEELALLAQTAREVGRLDETFRPYLPSVVRERIRRRGGGPPPVGEERVISVMFVDLSGFTPYSERHEPREVVEMLNAYWAEVVPVIDRAGGTIEHFEGDGLLTLFNVAGDQPDHAVRAVAVAREILQVTRPLGVAHRHWPVFRLGINTGSAIVGVLGTDARRSFAAVGDPVNTGARLMTVARAGEIVVGATTWAILADPTAGEPLGPVQVKGKRAPLEAWRLHVPEARSRTSV
jgi:class 3 adenylate cyclase